MSHHHRFEPFAQGATDLPNPSGPRLRRVRHAVTLYHTVCKPLTASPTGLTHPPDQVLACDVSGMLSIFSVRTGRLMVTKQLTAGNGFSRGGLFTLSSQTTAPAGAAGGARGPGSSGSLASASTTGGAITGSVVSICGVMRRQLYAVVTGHELSLWHVEHELDYNVARGGHDKAVIALYSCSGGVVGRGGLGWL